MTSEAVDISTSSQASSPFNDPEADLILRTSDAVNFRVYALLLRLSSPFFKDMLSLAQPAESTDQLYEGTTPIIPVTETSSVLDTVLRFCYPFDDPEIKVYSDLVPITDAMRKYQFVQFNRVAKLFCSPAVLEEKAFQSFAVVCKLKMEAETRLAAFYTLRQPLPTEPVPELAMINGLQYQQLLLYRQKCTEEAIALFKKRPWREGHYIWDTCGSACGSYNSSRWLEPFLNRVCQQLSATPWPTFLTMNSGEANNCSKCGPVAAVHWESCVKDMVPRFEEALRKVHFDIVM